MTTERSIRLRRKRMALTLREPAWRSTGTDPDYRFSLANERTFLAWIRTALAILAGGVLLDQFSAKIDAQWPVMTLALGLSAVSTVLCLLAYLRWRANEIAMRHGRRLPGTVAVPFLSVCLFLTGAGMSYLIFRR